MPWRLCPRCGRPSPRRLEAISQGANVDYYRCDGCAHVWTISRDGTHHVTHVTPLDPDPAQE